MSDSDPVRAGPDSASAGAPLLPGSSGALVPAGGATPSGSLVPGGKGAAEDGESARNPVEALADDFVRRLRKGENPSPTEYAAQFPEMADEIAELFPLMRALEVAKAPPKLRRPERLGDFRIIREIGRGGMGVVYEAEQESLGRRVAVKVLPPASGHSSNHALRFRREAQAAARLHHTNIVPVFGFGEQDGMFYYVMPLIGGQALDARTPGAGRKRWRLRKREDWVRIAEIGRQAADALECAHAKGILHRDIKPANLLLEADGRLWVTDFGLAKPTDGPDLTAVGDLVGTIRYMAPERFEGKTDARSDIWSLGLTLFELAAGRPAFDERNRGALSERITREGPPPLRALAPEIPPDLEAIIVKSAARNPDDRYARAGDMADDLRRFLADRPVSARRSGITERAGQWLRRRWAALAVCAAAGILLGLVAALWSECTETSARLGAEMARRTEAEAALRAAIIREAERAERAAAGHPIAAPYWRAVADICRTAGRLSASP